MEQHYSFKTPGLYSGITADAAHAELVRIRNKYGELSPENVVAESTDKDSILHSIFEWDDTAAAEKYRREQARHLIKNIEVKITIEHYAIPCRALVNVVTSVSPTRTYIPVEEAIADDTAYKDLLEQAKKEAMTFVGKYSQITELNKAKAALLEFVNLN